MQLITSAQCRAARALLNWSQPELAQRCGMHVQTISAFESEVSTPTKTTLQKIALAFEGEGIEFLPESGLRKRDQNVRIYQGQENYADFYQDVYNVARTVGGDFCVNNVNERDFLKWFTDEAKTHIGRMEELISTLSNFSMRILIEEGDTLMPGKNFASYRWVKNADFQDVPFYVYGDRLAIMIFEPDDVYICVIQNQRVADAYRAQFDISWNMAIVPPIET